MARLAAIVLLPTPPLPEPTAITLLAGQADLAQLQRRPLVLHDLDSHLGRLRKAGRSNSLQFGRASPATAGR